MLIDTFLNGPFLYSDPIKHKSFINTNKHTFEMLGVHNYSKLCPLKHLIHKS